MKIVCNDVITYHAAICHLLYDMAAIGYGIKNTFGIFVYSAEYIFKIID